MAYMDHINACNQFDLGDFVPFQMASGEKIGHVRKDNLAHLKAFEDVFELHDDCVRLISPNPTRDMADVTRSLYQAGLVEGWRDEDYKVAPSFSAPALFIIERCAVAFFGIRAFGVHLNGFVQKADGLHMWIAKRSPDRAIAPGKLDNMVAGGQPAHLSLRDNVIKECGEEAAVPAELARQAMPVGAISYCMETDGGLKPDVMYCYDLECPADFVPQNTDGEASGFELLPIHEVGEIVRDSDAFKFNCNLVIIDFLIRHGLMSPDVEPDYEAIVKGLHR